MKNKVFCDNFLFQIRKKCDWNLILKEIISLCVFVICIVSHMYPIVSNYTLYRFESPQAKHNMISSKTKIIYRVAPQNPKRLRSTIVVKIF